MNGVRKFSDGIDKSAVVGCLTGMEETTDMVNAADDQRIKGLLTADDPSALEATWNAYASDLFGYLLTIHRSRAEAEDSLQDVFVAIATKRARLAAACNLKAYLFRMARNIAINRIRREGRKREKERAASEWLEANETVADGDERSKQLAAALARLPEKQRVVVTLKFFRDHTFGEIAALLGISANTAASRLRYALEKLQTLFEEELQ